MADTTQDPKVREEMLARSTSGSGSATGQAKEQASGREDERLEGSEDREGPEDGPEKGDFGAVEYAQPVGLQAEPANFTSGGTIPAGMVSSPAGFVPLSAVGDPEAALERTLGKQGSTKDNRRLTEEDLEQLDGPSIRAIGTQRGYQMPDLAGRGTIRGKFLAEQEKDERFSEEEPAKKGLLAKLKK
jgi:hypothetical protein